MQTRIKVLENIVAYLESQKNQNITISQNAIQAIIQILYSTVTGKHFDPYSALALSLTYEAHPTALNPNSIYSDYMNYLTAVTRTPHTQTLNLDSKDSSSTTGAFMSISKKIDQLGLKLLDRLTGQTNSDNNTTPYDKTLLTVFKTLEQMALLIVCKSTYTEVMAQLAEIFPKLNLEELAKKTVDAITTVTELTAYLKFDKDFVNFNYFAQKIQDLLQTPQDFQEIYAFTGSTFFEKIGNNTAQIIENLSQSIHSVTDFLALVPENKAFAELLINSDTFQYRLFIEFDLKQEEFIQYLKIFPEGISHSLFEPYVIEKILEFINYEIFIALLKFDLKEAKALSVITNDYVNAGLLFKQVFMPDLSKFFNLLEKYPQEFTCCDIFVNMIADPNIRKHVISKITTIASAKAILNHLYLFSNGHGQGYAKFKFAIDSDDTLLLAKIIYPKAINLIEHLNSNEHHFKEFCFGFMMSHPPTVNYLASLFETAEQFSEFLNSDNAYPSSHKLAKLIFLKLPPQFFAAESTAMTIIMDKLPQHRAEIINLKIKKHLPIDIHDPCSIIASYLFFAPPKPKLDLSLRICAPTQDLDSKEPLIPKKKTALT